MPRVAECPDPPSLERLLLGLDDEVAEVMQHLAGCPLCGGRMRVIRATDAVVEAMRDMPTVVGSTDSELLRSMVPLLKCLRPREATLTWLSDGDTTAFNGITYSFLGPASGDELGSLGPYRILEVLGTGGMGIVFLAHDELLNRKIAVKVIKPGLNTKADAVERFLNEARAVARVEHDNIVPIYQAEVLQGTPFLAMPLLRGETLEARLQREKAPLPVVDVLRIGRETALGLAAAHERNLIHRDIKPANLWLDAGAGGRVKILDFGLAAASSGAVSEIAGTPAYMAPEQASGKVIDGRADLFSLGCVLYRAATGKPAFQGADTIRTLMSVATDTPQAPRELNPLLPVALDELIVALLAKRPDDRPASALEVVARIEQLERPKRSWLSRRGWLVATGAGGLAVSGGLWAWWNWPTAPVPEQKPPFAGELRKHEMHQGAVTALALHERAGQLLAVSASQDRRVFLWDPTKDEKPTPLRLNRDGSFFDVPLLTLAVTPDGKRVAVGGGDRATANGNRLYLWDIETRKEIPLRLGGQQGLIQAVAFEPDGVRIVEGRSDGWISVWDLEKGAGAGGYADRDPKRHNLGIWAVAVAPSGDYALAGGGDGSVIVLGLKPIAHRMTYHDVHPDGVLALAIFADGRGFVSAGKDGVIRVWDREGQSRTLLGHAKAVTSVALSADGSRLISGGEDGTLRVWHVERGEAIGELKANTKAINCVAITADGSHAVSGGSDGTLRFWKLPP